MSMSTCMFSGEAPFPLCGGHVLLGASADAGNPHLTLVSRGDRSGSCPDCVDGFVVPPWQGPWSLISVQRQCAGNPSPCTVKEHQNSGFRRASDVQAGAWERLWCQSPRSLSPIGTQNVLVLSARHDPKSPPRRCFSWEEPTGSCLPAGKLC